MSFRQFDIALGEDKVAVDVVTSASALLAVSARGCEGNDQEGLG